MNDHRILDLSEAAAFLHASEDAVTAYVRSGELPAGKVGKKLIFLQRHLLEFADANIAAQTASRRDKQKQVAVPFEKRSRSRPPLPVLPSQIERDTHE